MQFTEYDIQDATKGQHMNFRVNGRAFDARCVFVDGNSSRWKIIHTQYNPDFLPDGERETIWEGSAIARAEHLARSRRFFFRVRLADALKILMLVSAIILSALQQFTAAIIFVIVIAALVLLVTPKTDS